MEIFLQIIGSLALAIMLIIIGIYAYIKISLGKYTSKDMTPLIIHLNEDINPNWISKKNAVKIEEELINLGFTPNNTYHVVEMEGMQLKSFFNTPYTAVMYIHPVVGIWVDIVANIENGVEYTVTNAPMGGEIKTPPNTEKHWLKDFSITDLFSKLKNIVGTQKIKALNSTSFRDYFENAYKREMQWKNKNGGVSFEEFMSVVENDPKNYNEKDMMVAYIKTKKQELLKWHDAAIKEYKEKENLQENDCYDIFDSLFIVPSKTDNIAFIYYLRDLYFIDEQHSKKLEEKYKENKTITIKKLFQEINEGFSPELRAEYKFNTDYPIDIEIFEMKKENY